MVSKENKSSINRPKHKNILVSISLVLCVTLTSFLTFTTEVDANSLSFSNLKSRLSLKKNNALTLESENIVKYDFSNYKIVDSTAEKHTRTFNAVDTIIQITIYNDDPNIDVEKIINETEELVQDYENLISKTKSGSFTYTLNSTGEYDYSKSKYSSVIHQLVDKSTYYEKLSKGALDVTIEPIVKLWNINNGGNIVPSQSNIDTALTPVNYNNFVLDEENQKYELLNGATVDFGAIGKGQLADIIKASLMSKGINSALVNLGGNVITIGAKPGDKNWVIGVQNPNASTGELIGTINIKNKSVVTSGNYERYFIANGVRYHHIMDTSTGYPVNSGLVQTTIISDHSIDCDALSTTTFILGKEKGLDLIKNLDGFECMFIDENMNYSFSDNFNKNYNFEPSK